MQVNASPGGLIRSLVTEVSVPVNKASLKSFQRVALNLRDRDRMRAPDRALRQKAFKNGTQIPVWPKRPGFAFKINGAL